ncbi:hypothetical protein RRG08_054388 [Elysia crispata]|uniref:Uncharacterized protein n=1 Tax=Elysia crispata TaxID=231223 RepID=A0AAE1E9X3_9GAST|nr:hypothetical protein RRG08_054388 [Elysia crispata]
MAVNLVAAESGQALPSPPFPYYLVICSPLDAARRTNTTHSGAAQARSPQAEAARLRLLIFKECLSADSFDFLSYHNKVEAPLQNFLDLHTTRVRTTFCTPLTLLPGAAQLSSEFLTSFFLL